MDVRSEGTMEHMFFHTVLDRTSQCKYICYTRRKNGVFTVCLTDAADVWSTEDTEETLNQFRQRFSLKSTEDYVQKLRSACAHGDVSVVVHDASLELHLGSSPGGLSENLNKLDDLQAAGELKELLFRMAECLTKPDCGPPHVSAVKSPQEQPAGIGPGQQHQRKGGQSVTIKKRPQGSSIINPGSKRKLQATGVAFDDADED